MNRNHNTIGFSFYELSLLSFLRESHPDKAGDIPFIKARAAEAAEAYSNAFLDGSTASECADIANRTLYRGLHFSKHDTLVAVLHSEFWDVISSDELKETALRLQTLCEEVFAKYPLDNEFGSTPEYQLLYTEIVGTLQLKLEEDGSL